MSYFLGFFQYISDMGATVMMPIIICVMGCILGAGFGKSLRAGLTVGIGFIGLNLVTGLWVITLHRQYRRWQKDLV